MVVYSLMMFLWFGFSLFRNVKLFPMFTKEVFHFAVSALSTFKIYKDLTGFEKNEMDFCHMHGKCNC